MLLKKKKKKKKTNQVLDFQGLETVCALVTLSRLLPFLLNFQCLLTPLENTEFDLIMATFQNLIILKVSTGLKRIMNHVLK